MYTVVDLNLLTNFSNSLVSKLVHLGKQSFKSILGRYVRNCRIFLAGILNLREYNCKINSVPNLISLKLIPLIPYFRCKSLRI